MLPLIEHRELLSGAWPTVSLIALTGLAIVAWFASHWLSRRVTASIPGKFAAACFFALRALVGSITLFLIVNILARFFVLETASSLALGSVIFAVAIEALIAAYDWEARLISPAIGRLIVGLRVLALLLLGLVLLQPVFAWNIPRVQERFVAVLMDQSTSMELSDEQLTEAEKLGLLRMLDPKTPIAPYDLAAQPAELRAAADQLALSAEECLVLADQAESTRTKAHMLSVEEQLQATSQALTQTSLRLRDLTDSTLALEAATLEKTNALIQRIDGDLSARLSRLKEQVAEAQTIDADVLRTTAEQMQAITAGLREISNEMPGLIEAADKAFFASLPPESLERAEQIAQRTRADIARSLLLGEGETKGILEKILAGYSVRCFGFDSTVREVDSQQLNSLFTQAKSESPTPPSNESATSATADDATKASTTEGESTAANIDSSAGEASAEDNAANDNAVAAENSSTVERRTNLAQALEFVRSEIPGESLAGVLLITDGRQSEGASPDDIAARFATLSIPISSLSVGSERAPVDAKILEIDRPSSVLVGDSLVVSSRVEISGMKGRSVVAKLVSKGETLQERTIEVPEDDFFTTLELRHDPEEEGLADYEVTLVPVGAEGLETAAFESNNSRTFSVAISDQRTKILLIEGKPRWEYGYLRNLFAGRDATVQLQTVLFEPERLASTGNLPVIHASASREPNQIEATALPENEKEWFQFDVIIMGDIGQKHLSAEQQDLLRRFVSERGGALIVISGADHMPHAWMGTPLEELFPIEVAASTEVQFKAPETGYRWTLTSIGERHAITRQGDSIEASRAVWDQMPDLYWRHAVTGTKPGSVVLAYATPSEENSATDAVADPAAANAPAADNAPANQDAAPADSPPAAPQALTPQEFEQQHALLAMRNYGAGKVLMLATDHTWRFRYRVGDERHHRFWGQVVRWGTADRLQSGGDFIQLGTDRQEYETGDPIAITARLTDSSFAPIEDAEAEIRVYRNDTMVISQRLATSVDRPGDYSATLAELSEPGTYRLELVSKEAQRVFSGSDESKVETTIEVLTPELASPEFQETTADTATLERLAARTGGGMVNRGPADPSRWFREGTRRYDEVRRIQFWDSWPILVLLVAAFTAEWIARKKKGLV